MSHPFNFKYAEPEVLNALSAFQDGCAMKTEIVGLLKRKWVNLMGYHHLALSPVGKLAQKGLFVDTTVLVSKSDSLRHGDYGIIKSIRPAKVDSDGYDEYGYQYRWAKDIAIITVAFPDHPGEWCFYSEDDLIPVVRSS